MVGNSCFSLRFLSTLCRIYDSAVNDSVCGAMCFVRTKPSGLMQAYTVDKAFEGHFNCTFVAFVSHLSIFFFAQLKWNKFYWIAPCHKLHTDRCIVCKVVIVKT